MYILVEDAKKDTWPFLLPKSLPRDVINVNNSKVKGNSFDLKIMAYNLLSDKYAMMQMRACINGRENNCSPFNIYEFDYRFDLLR